MNFGSFLMGVGFGAMGALCIWVCGRLLRSQPAEAWFGIGFGVLLIITAMLHLVAAVSVDTIRFNVREKDRGTSKGGPALVTDDGARIAARRSAFDAVDVGDRVACRASDAPILERTLLSCEADRR